EGAAGRGGGFGGGGHMDWVGGARPGRFVGLRGGVRRLVCTCVAWAAGAASAAGVPWAAWVALVLGLVRVGVEVFDLPVAEGFEAVVFSAEEGEVAGCSDPAVVPFGGVVGFGGGGGPVAAGEAAGSVAGAEEAPDRKGGGVAAA